MVKQRKKRKEGWWLKNDRARYLHLDRVMKEFDTAKKIRDGSLNPYEEYEQNYEDSSDRYWEEYDRLSKLNWSKEKEKIAEEFYYENYYNLYPEEREEEFPGEKYEESC